MIKIFTFSTGIKKLFLINWVIFTFLLLHTEAYAQISLSDFGPMYNPHLINVRADGYYIKNVIFDAYQYDFIPPGTPFPPEYALVLYNGSYLPPVFDPNAKPPILVTAEDPSSPLGVNIFTDEIGPFPQPDLPFPLITNTLLQSSTTDPKFSFKNNAPFTSEMAVSVFWGMQYVVNVNKNLYAWTGIDNTNTKPIVGFLRQNFPGAASYNSKLNRFSFGVNNGIPHVGLEIVGHEMGHAILNNSYFLKPSKNLSVLQNQQIGALEEGFAYEMGLLADNYYRLDNNLPITWVLNDPEEATGKDIILSNLKGNNFPATYLGKNYNPNSYDEILSNSMYKYINHLNGTVILSWLYKAANGWSGHIDENDLRPYSRVNPLDSDPFFALEEASKFLFKVYTDPTEAPLITGFDTWAESALRIAKKEYKYGTSRYVTIHNALFAVGLWPANYEDAPTNPLPKGGLSGKSQYNNSVGFDGTELTGTIKGDQATFPVTELKSDPTATMPGIETQYINADGDLEKAMDADQNQIYSLYNDKARSAAAVSVHFASEQTARYLYANHTFIGIDGQGVLPIKSYLQQDVKIPGFNPDDLAFYYDYDGDPGNPRPAVSMDLVGSNIGYAAAYLKLKPDPASEAEIICKGLGDILGLQIKNKELTAQSKPTVWTIGEDLFNGNDYLRSFSDPKSRKQPIYYKGELYDELAADPVANASLLNFWFYILSEGKTGHLDNDLSRPMYSVTSIGKGEAEEILWAAVMNSNPGEVTDFLSLRKAAEAAATTPPELHAVQEAFYAIGVGPSPEELLASSPKDQEVEINPWPLNGPIGLKKEILYPDFEKGWEVDISVDGTFKGKFPIHTIKNLTRDKDTQLDNNGVRTLRVSSLNLQTGTKYYWRVRTTDFDMCHFGLSPTDCAELQFQLSLGTNVRSFTTDGRDIDKAQIETPYPWGPAFHWATKADVVGSEIQYYILNIFHQDEKEPFIQRAYAPKPGATQFNPTTKPDYLVLKPETDYGWAVRAMGPEDVFGQKTFSLATRMDFKTDEVTSSLIFPENKKKIDLFHYNTNIEIAPIFFTKWQEAVNADGYRVEYSKNQTDFSKLVPESDPNYYGTLKLFNPGPSPDGNNTYFWRVTPLGPPLTNEDLVVLNEGSTSDVRSLTYDYKSTKPKLREFSSVAALQPQIHFSWQEVPGADYYKIILGHRGTLNPDAPDMIEVVYKTALVSLGNGIMGFDRVYSGTSTLPLKDLASSADGYEWQVTAYKKEALLDFPGEPARSSYDVLPGMATILTPKENEVISVTDVTNQSVTYRVDCPFAPGGFKFTMGLQGQPTTFLTPGNVPFIIPPHTGELQTFPATSGQYEFTIPGTLFWDHDYYAQFIPLGREGTGLEGQGQLRLFHTPPDPNKKKDDPDPAPAGTHAITITWKCNGGTYQGAGYDIYQITQVSTGKLIYENEQGPIGSLVTNTYMMGYDNNGSFKAPVDEDIVWGDYTTVIGWIVNGDLPPGDYLFELVSMSSGSTATCTPNVNIDLDGTTLPQQTPLVAGVFHSTFVTITIP